MEIGITSFVETKPDVHNGEVMSYAQRLREVVEEVTLADEVGLDMFLYIIVMYAFPQNSKRHAVWACLHQAFLMVFSPGSPRLSSYSRTSECQA
jgi:hypothetical protein